MDGQGDSDQSTPQDNNQPFAMPKRTKKEQQEIDAIKRYAAQSRKHHRREALLRHYAVAERVELKPGEPIVIVRTNRGDYITVNPPKPCFATGLCVYDGPPGAFAQDLRTYFPTVKRAHYRKLCWSTLTAIEHGLWDIGNLLQRVKLLGYTETDCNVLFVANGMSWDGLDCNISSHLSESRRVYYKGIIKERNRALRLRGMRRSYHAGTLEQRKAMIAPEIRRKLAAMRLENCNPESMAGVSPMEETRDGVIETGATQEPSSAPDKAPNQLNKEGQLRRCVEDQMEGIRFQNDKRRKCIEDLRVAERLHHIRIVQKNEQIIQKNEQIIQKNEQIIQKNEHIIQKNEHIIQKNEHIIQKNEHILQLNEHILQQGARIRQQDARIDQLEQQLKLQKEDNPAVRDRQTYSDQPPIAIQTPLSAAQNGTAEAALLEDRPASPTASTTSSESWTEILPFR
ncbi:hypothetical protein F5X68DRAFT_279248 [Plectosphaerella plurivora]|uniref:Uncharacterized protein n=1 Tax=Plectosphaerella plurivora TaxID=936078 RepID=A0A9P8V1V2_9PEZI|nr:hypothetical protein F5X68DRAFT_279248 [Plectosphaerella plurivora]